MKKILLTSWVIVTVAVLLLSIPVFAEGDAELAKKLANPVASLISVPIQTNYD